MLRLATVTCQGAMLQPLRPLKLLSRATVKTDEICCLCANCTAGTAGQTRAVGHFFNNIEAFQQHVQDSQSCDVSVVLADLDVTWEVCNPLQHVL